MIVLILGMHRSGTSAVAGMLQQGGIYLGDVFMPPMEENPKGFFEDLRFQNVNKQILSSIGKTWMDLPSLDELRRVPPQLKQAMQQVYDLFRSKAESWAWKDPRMCITFPLWTNVLPRNEIKVIFCLRHPMSVAQSLTTRNNISIEKGLEIWKNYTLCAHEVVKRYRLPAMLVRYETIVEKPKSVQNQIEGFLDIDLKDAWKFIDKDLNRSHSENQRIPIDIENVYKKILEEWKITLIKNTCIR